MPTKADLEKSNATLRKRVKTLSVQLAGTEAKQAEHEDRLATMQVALATQDSARRDIESAHDERTEILLGALKQIHDRLTAIEGKLGSPSH